jgi:hypothetical protein
MFTRCTRAAVLALAAQAAAAAPTLINADLVSGIAAFDAAVTATGSAVGTQGLRDLQEGATRWSFADFSISASDGTPRFIEDDYAGLRGAGAAGALSGWAIGLSVNEPARSWGLTFEFHRPVNAFGLEVGDWGTCCYASSLFISFDGGATREVATAWDGDDNPGFSAYGRYTNFVGAFDTSGSFRRVSFYGAGIGEYMVGGGTIRYGLLPLDDRDNPPPLNVPEPAVWTAGLAALMLTSRSARRAARQLQRRMVQQRLQHLA